MSQTVSNGNSNSNRECSFMGGPKLVENEDIGDTDDISTIQEEEETSMTKTASSLISDRSVVDKFTYFIINSTTEFF